jgi:hypothetical protein
MGGYGIPDDANVHFLSPITAISICLETSQGKQKKNYRLICALPLGMDIRKKRSIVKVVGPTFTHHFVVAHSRPAIPCSFNAFPNPTSPFLVYYDVILIRYYLKKFIFFWWLLYVS